MIFDFIVSPLKLDWRITDHQPKTTRLWNSAGFQVPFADLLVQVPGPPSFSPTDFIWQAQGFTIVTGGHDLSVTVTPPAPGSGPKTGSLTFQVSEANGPRHQDVTVNLSNNAVAKVMHGDIVISDLLFDPPGRDLDNEGEYIELTKFLRLTTSTLPAAS